MTRSELINLWNSLQNVKGTFSKYLYYAIEKTKTNIKSEIDNIVKVESELLNSPEMRIFEDLRTKLLIELAKKDENGNPITIKEGNVERVLLGDNENEFNDRLVELIEINKEAIQKNSDNRTKFNQFLAEEVEVNVVKTELKYLPDEMDRDMTEVLLKLVKDEIG